MCIWSIIKKMIVEMDFNVLMIFNSSKSKSKSKIIYYRTENNITINNTKYIYNHIK